MPKIYEYLGISIFFFSREHEPIHVHARYGEFQSRAEFIIADGKVVDIRIIGVKGSDPLVGKVLKNFEDFLEVFADEMIQKWVDYFVYGKKLKLKRITKKL